LNARQGHSDRHINAKRRSRPSPNRDRVAQQTASKAGNTVNFLLTAKRDRKAALRFLYKAIAWHTSQDYHRQERLQHCGDREI
jgi:hypothetical protein